MINKTSNIQLYSLYSEPQAMSHLFGRFLPIKAQCFLCIDLVQSLTKLDNGSLSQKNVDKMKTLHLASLLHAHKTPKQLHVQSRTHLSACHAMNISLRSILKLPHLKCTAAGLTSNPSLCKIVDFNFLALSATQRHPGWCYMVLIPLASCTKVDTVHMPFHSHHLFQSIFL